ncbi:hypothetical protein GWI33_009759, partial [Rhynchophorus ferrugineus]
YVSGIQVNGVVGLMHPVETEKETAAFLSDVPVYSWILAKALYPEERYGTDLFHGWNSPAAPDTLK